MYKRIFSIFLVVVLAMTTASMISFAQVTEVKGSPSHEQMLSDWKISPSVPGTTSGLPGGDDAEISKVGYDTSAWLPAKAPSTVLGNCIDAGVYNEFFLGRSGNIDPFFNRQFTSLPAADFNEPWWYSTNFTVPADQAGKKVTLAIGGMTYMADLYVNGVQVFNEHTNITDMYDLWNGPPVYGLAKGDAADFIDITNVGSNRAQPFGAQNLDAYRTLIVGSFRRFDIDVTNYLNPAGTPNNIKFKITKPLSQQDLTYHWVDWHPRPVDSMMGLTGEVYIRTSGPVRLNNPAVSTVVAEDQSTAAVTLYCDATNLTDSSVTGTLQAILRNPAGNAVATVSKQVSIPAQVYNCEVLFRASDFPALVLNDPELWYPAGSGGQPLYTVEWSFTYVGTVSDRIFHRAGLRQVSVDMNVTPLGNQNRTTIAAGSGANMIQFYFNHKPVMLKGGGYCPTDIFLRHDPVQNQGVIDNMIYAGLNMFRDEGKFFDNDLLDLCDEYGIVVMTGWCCCDRHQSPNNWSKCERFWGYEEQFAQTKNLRQHASGALWFNGSDQPASYGQSSRSNSWMVEEMYHIIEAKCRWDVIGITAPSSCLDTSKLLGGINGGFHMDSSYDNVSPTYMFNPASAQQNGEGPFGFISEGLGGANIPSIETMKKIIPAGNMWPYNNATNYSSWNLHATTSGTLTALVTLSENGYGASTSLASWHAKATAQCYDQYRAQYEAINYFRFTNNTGLVNWMLNSCRPNMYWSEFDFYMNPTAATFGIAKANEPLHIMYNPYAHDVSVINSSFDAYDNMTAEVSVYNLSGELINTPLVTTLDVAPDGVGPTTDYGTGTSARTPRRNGWHFDETLATYGGKTYTSGAFTPMDYVYNGIIKDAYGVNILWGYEDIEASLIAPMSDVYFLRLTLTDGAGNVASTNSYAVAYRGDITCATGWFYGPPIAAADLSALNSLPALTPAQLTCVQTASAAVGGNVVQTLVVSNNSPYIAHNVYLSAYPDSACTDLIGAVQYSDNMFMLLPGEARTITVTHRASNLVGNAYITVTCYNNQIGGDRPIRYQNVYTGLGAGMGRSLTIGKTVTGSGGGTPGNLTTLPATCLNAAIAHKTFIDSALAYNPSSPSDLTPTYYTYSPTANDYSASTPGSGTAWFYVDLGESKPFDELMLRFSGSRSLRGRPDTIVIAGSNNATTWTDIATCDNSSGSIMTDIVLPKTETYRYVRVSLSGALQATFNVAAFDIYAFNNYIDVSVVGAGVVKGDGKSVVEDSTANQKIVSVAEGGSIDITFVPDVPGAPVRAVLDGVDVSGQIKNNVLTVSGLTGDATLDVLFGIHAFVNTNDETYCGDPIPYTVSLVNVKEIGTIKLSFTVDTANQSLNLASAVTPLNGFSTLKLDWADLGGGVWKGTATLMYPGFITALSPLDVLMITTNALNTVADVSLEISSLEVTGNLGGLSGFQPSTIIVPKATTSIVNKQPIYSKYDLNHDGAIDILDTNIAVKFYLKTSASAGWATEKFDLATAQDADVNETGRVDLADLIEIMANYCASYDLFPY